MLYLSPAKINLFLRIVGRRENGYHNLQSLFSHIDLYDKLYIEIIEKDIIRKNDIENIPVHQDLNIKAAIALKQYAIINNISNAATLGALITVNKNIPQGAGLGGGSGNAATILLQLNKLWNLNYDIPTLQNIGLKLGADVPFFIHQQTALIEGIGEQIHALTLPTIYLIIFKPSIHINTAQIFIYAKLIRNNSILNTNQYIDFFNKSTYSKNTQSVIDKCYELGNTMQNVVLEIYPSLQQEILYLEKKINTKLQMTGSGSCFFAMFSNSQDRDNALEELKLPIDWNMYICQTI